MKKRTQVLQNLQRALSHIEDNLFQKVAIEELSKISALSIHHFQRSFKEHTNYSIKDYIRKRRLSEAAIELLLKETSVTELAFKMQYESVEAFSRAFKKEFKITPRNLKKEFTQIEIIKSKTIAKNKRIPKGFIVPPYKFIIKKEPLLSEYLVYDMKNREDIERVKFTTDNTLLAEFGYYRHRPEIVFDDESNELIVPIKKMVRINMRMEDILNLTVEEMKLSTKSYNCVKKANLNTMADLVSKTEKEMLAYEGFSDLHVQAFSDLLKHEYGLKFGMKVKK